MATMPRPMPPGPAPPGGPPGAPPGPMGGPPPGPMGGPPPGPMGGPMMQGALGNLAGLIPGGDPANALRSLQMTPPPDNVEVAIKRGQDALGYAMSAIHQRSPEVAKELASALMNVKQALQKLQMLPREDVPRPPMGLPMAGLLGGGPPPGPAPMPANLG